MAAPKASDELAISLASLPPTLAQRRFAFVVVVLQFAVCAVVAPFPALVPRIDSFVPVILAIVFVADLITAFLLLNQSSAIASRALLVLANGYLFSALIVIPHALTFPGAFAPKGLLGAGVQSSGWLNVFWHLGFLVAVAGYAYLKGGERRDAAIFPSALSSFWWSAAIQVSLVCALTWAITAGDEFMPRLFLDDLSNAPLVHYAAGMLVLISVLVLLLTWTRRTSVLDLWVMVAICMLISEMALVAFGVTARFYLGWYVSRILAVTVSTVVLIALLSESMRLYVELSRANLMLERERMNNREHAAAFMESQTRLQEALTAGAAMAFEWDARTGLAKLSANAAQILGYDPAQHSSNVKFHSLAETRFYSRIHPDDRARFEASVYGVRPDNPSYTVAYRFIRPDGREVWLESTSSAEFDPAGRYTCSKGMIRDITRRKRNEERQNVLIAELDHRVKNVLARVAVVASYTRQGSRTMDEFIKVFDGRIQALAAAHALLSQSRWQGVDLAALVRDQLAPYACKANTTLTGPDVTLGDALTQAVAMALHELVTNAAKYGALSVPAGRVSVSWSRHQNEGAAESLMLDWRETGGPPLLAAIQPGYGTSLIRDLIPHELGGTVDLVFAVEGVRCRIEVPLNRA